MNTIGIFTGKQEKHNKQLLTLLYNNGPLTAWELTAKATNVGNRQSLHATYNKSLRNLEKKGYVNRTEKKWLLGFKGIIAVLLIQPKPKMWSPIWTKLFEKSVKALEEYSEPLLGVEKTRVQGALEGFKSLGLFLDDFSAFVNLSKKVKELMKRGVINFDIIKEETLLTIITMETIMETNGTDYLKQLSALFKES